MNKITIIIVLLLFIFTGLIAETKTPMKAAALSLFIPGGGQFYNESYLKSAVVFSMEATLLGLTLYNHIKAEDAYDKYAITMDEADYNTYLDYYYKRQDNLWWTGVYIFLSVVDAFVDAHLYDYQAKKRDVHLKFEDSSVSLIYKF